jgi:hypothetical protein
LNILTQMNANVDDVTKIYNDITNTMSNLFTVNS